VSAADIAFSVSLCLGTLVVLLAFLTTGFEGLRGASASSSLLLSPGDYASAVHALFVLFGAFGVLLCRPRARGEREETSALVREVIGGNLARAAEAA
jgi:hypothetical protein